MAPYFLLLVVLLQCLLFGFARFPLLPPEPLIVLGVCAVFVGLLGSLEPARWGGVAAAFPALASAAWLNSQGQTSGSAMVILIAVQILVAALLLALRSQTRIAVFKNITK